MADIRDDDPRDNQGDGVEARRQAAVALKKFGVGDDVIPKVVAAGYGRLAEEIVRLAFENGVNVREDRALAEMLAAVELNSDIPSEALVAVAEVLSYVYKLDGTYPSGKGATPDAGGADDR